AEDSQSLAFVVAMARGACELKHSLGGVPRLHPSACEQVGFSKRAQDPRLVDDGADGGDQLRRLVQERDSFSGSAAGRPSLPQRACHYQAHYLEVLALGAVKAPLQPGKGPRGVAAAKADQPEFALCHGEPVSIVERLGHPQGLVHPRDRRGSSPIRARASPMRTRDITAIEPGIPKRGVWRSPTSVSMPHLNAAIARVYPPRQRYAWPSRNPARAS